MSRVTHCPSSSSIHRHLALTYPPQTSTLLLRHPHSTPSGRHEGTREKGSRSSRVGWGGVTVFGGVCSTVSGRSLLPLCSLSLSLNGLFPLKKPLIYVRSPRPSDFTQLLTSPNAFHPSTFTLARRLSRRFFPRRLSPPSTSSLSYRQLTTTTQKGSSGPPTSSTTLAQSNDLRLDGVRAQQRGRSSPRLLDG